MSAECVSAFMSSVGAQLCPQPSIPSIPNQNESSHCLCDAFELASRKLWECEMCYVFVDYVVQINTEAHTHTHICLFVSYSARQLRDVLIISIFCGFMN